MNDFLKSLRTKEKQRYDRNNRKPYNNQYNGNQYPGNPQYKGNEGNYKKGPGYRSEEMDKLMETLGQALPEIKIVIDNIAENQSRLAEAEERRAGAEERKAGAFEALADSVKAILDKGISLPANPGISYAPAPVPVEVEKPVRSSAVDRENVLHTIYAMRENGATYTEIASQLDSESIPTFSGKGKWHAQTIHRLCQERN